LSLITKVWFLVEINDGHAPVVVPQPFILASFQSIFNVLPHGERNLLCRVFILYKLNIDRRQLVLTGTLTDRYTWPNNIPTLVR
jgi:hypothetical protein